MAVPETFPRVVDGGLRPQRPELKAVIPRRRRGGGFAAAVFSGVYFALRPQAPTAPARAAPAWPRGASRARVRTWEGAAAPPAPATGVGAPSAARRRHVVDPLVAVGTARPPGSPVCLERTRIGLDRYRSSSGRRRPAFVVGVEQQAAEGDEGGDATVPESSFLNQLGTLLFLGSAEAVRPDPCSSPSAHFLNRSNAHDLESRRYDEGGGAHQGKTGAAQRQVVRGDEAPTVVHVAAVPESMECRGYVRQGIGDAMGLGCLCGGFDGARPTRQRADQCEFLFLAEAVERRFGERAIGEILVPETSPRRCARRSMPARGRIARRRLGCPSIVRSPARGRSRGEPRFRASA